MAKFQSIIKLKQAANKGQTLFTNGKDLAISHQLSNLKTVNIHPGQNGLPNRPPTKNDH